MYIDAHLDLAFQLSKQLNPALPLEELRERAVALEYSDIPLVSFEELRRGGVGLCFATLFACPYHREFSPWGYTDWQGAAQQAQTQLEQYLRWQDAGLVRILLNQEDVQDHFKKYDPQNHARESTRDSKNVLGIILLMEGADPIRKPDDLEKWFKAGVRMIGPAWEKTRYAGGTDQPGPLTGMGHDLLIGMQEMGIVLDVSHMDDLAFWEAIDLQPKVIASHANARALVPTNRHLSDEMLHALQERGGTLGLVPFNKFLQPDWDRPMPRLELAVLRRHAEHCANILGWDHIGIGSDFDGGLGLNEIPLGFSSIADFIRFGEVAPESERAGILGGNWKRWLEGNF